MPQRFELLSHLPLRQAPTYGNDQKALSLVLLFRALHPILCKMVQATLNLSDCASTLQYQGDIAGIGVRLSFYMQGIILLLNSCLSSNGVEDAYKIMNGIWLLALTSFGLTITALHRVSMGQLSLLEGILASQLIWFGMLGAHTILLGYVTLKWVAKTRVLRLFVSVQNCAKWIRSTRKERNVNTGNKCNKGRGEPIGKEGKSDQRCIRNNNSEWGFGQVLALVMVVPSTLHLCESVIAAFRQTVSKETMSSEGVPLSNLP
ncbi:hypothetical protein BU17DRAFT_68721 [Hysterangium stoloniferum]|nr:hypothetical protein BU17DRAFT_68721 [Hysterangium stoloniferum]